MDRFELLHQQAQTFRDFANKTPDGDLLSLFNSWSPSKELSHEDREIVWQLVRKPRARRGKGSLRLHPKLTVQYKDDPKLLDELLKFILNTIELADASPEEVERIQEMEIDNL